MKLATLFTVQTLTESEKKAFRMQYGIPYVIADDGGTIHYPTASDYHMARDFGFDANIVTLGSVAPISSTGKETAIKVVLTIAHLDHDVANNDYGNLRALCQRCHNRHDIEFRKSNRKLPKK